jgi:hypothetical protein
MATWQLIEHTSRTLQRIIKAHVDAMWTGSSVDVKIATPHAFRDLKDLTQATITIFLYRTSENAELRNGLQRRTPSGALTRQPMALELCYLITPWGARAGNPSANDEAAAYEEQKLMGLVLQALYDHAELSRAELFELPPPPLPPIPPPVWGAVDSLQIVHDTLPIEDLYRIWDSSALAYQLSATYRVRVMGLETSEERAVAPVVDAAFTVGRTG